MNDALGQRQISISFPFVCFSSFRFLIEGFCVSLATTGNERRSSQLICFARVRSAGSANRKALQILEGRAPASLRAGTSQSSALHVTLKLSLACPAAQRWFRTIFRQIIDLCSICQCPACCFAKRFARRFH